MKKYGWLRKMSCAALFAVALGAETVAAGNLKILADEYPPLTFTREGKVTGLAAEITDEVIARIGEQSRLKLIPWARAYQMMLKEPDVLGLPVYRTVEREKLFKWAGPLTTVKTSFYAKRGSNLKLGRLADAKSVERIIVPKAYWTYQMLIARGFTNLEPVPTSQQSVRMLLAGHGTLLAADNITLPSLLTEVGGRATDVESILTFEETESYFAFSQGTPDEVVQKWQAALDDMKRDGTFARLYKKWLPDETPPGLYPSKELIKP